MGVQETRGPGSNELFCEQSPDHGKLHKTKQYILFHQLKKYLNLKFDPLYLAPPPTDIYLKSQHILFSITFHLNGSWVPGYMLGSRGSSNICFAFHQQLEPGPLSEPLQACVSSSVNWTQSQLGLPGPLRRLRKAMH